MVGPAARRVRLRGHEVHPSVEVAFSPDGRSVASGRLLRRPVRLWDACRTARASEAAPAVDCSTFSGVAFSPDGTTVAAGATTARSGCGTCAPTGSSRPPLGRRARNTTSGRRLQPRRTHARSGRRRRPVRAAGTSAHADRLAAARSADRAARSASPSARTGARSPPGGSGSGLAVGRRTLAEARLALPRARRGLVTIGSRLQPRRAHARRGARRRDGAPVGRSARAAARAAAAGRHRPASTGLTFSPDGRTLARPAPTGGSSSGTSHSHKPLGRASLHRGSWVSRVAFSPRWTDARVRAARKGVRLWRGFLWHDLADLRTQVCRLVAGSLTSDEWLALAPASRTGRPARAKRASSRPRPGR